MSRVLDRVVDMLGLHLLVGYGLRVYVQLFRCFSPSELSSDLWEVTS